MAVIGLLLSRRRLVVGCWFIVVVPLVALAILFPEYRAVSLFKPESSQGLSRLAGLAAQFGVAVPVGGEDESLDFYARLVRSRELLQRVVTHSFRFTTKVDGGDTITGNWLGLYELENDNSHEELLEASEHLSDHVGVSRDLRTGLVTVAVDARWARLAEQVNREILRQINEFNLTTRQSRARAERRFVEDRLSNVRRELENAEQDLERFLIENRSYRESPRLTFEADRLQRVVDLQQQVYLNLAQTYEQARIDEVRDTPIITVVDAPEGSAKKSPLLIRNVVIGSALGLAVGLTFLLLEQLIAFDRARRPAEYRRLLYAWRGDRKSATGDRGDGLNPSDPSGPEQTTSPVRSAARAESNAVHSATDRSAPQATRGDK